MLRGLRTPSTAEDRTLRRRRRRRKGTRRERRGTKTVQGCTMRG
jgi:hypothetical protein